MFLVGDRGNGTLAIANGGQVINVNLSVGGQYYGVIGNGGGSTGEASVVGALSLWSAGGGLAVGLYGTGHLNIKAGGQVADGTGDMGADVGSAGTAIVDGAGSIWSNSLNLSVGELGTGNLTVTNGGTVTVGSQMFVGALGEVHGDGNISGNVSNSGLVSPGNTLGPLHITGDYTQTSAGKLIIELGGITAGSQYDQLLVSGTIELDGTLQVSLVGFSPVAGNSFHILDFTSRTGTFATLQLPGGGLTWETSQLYTTGVLTVGGLFGDYDHDGVIDAADYTVWRDTLGSTGAGLAADGNFNGMIDSGDYDVWKIHFGQTAPGDRAGATAAIPEPASLWMFLAGILTMCCRQRSKMS